MKKLFIIRVRINEGIIDRGDKMDQLIASHGWWIDMLTCQQKKKELMNKQIDKFIHQAKFKNRKKF